MSKKITVQTPTSDLAQMTQGISEKEAIASLMALLESLAYEVCSGDKWFLAMLSAKQIAVKKYGVQEEVFIDMMTRFDTARKAKNKQNPMSSMF